MYSHYKIQYWLLVALSALSFLVTGAVLVAGWPQMGPGARLGLGCCYVFLLLYNRVQLIDTREGLRKD